MPVDKWDVTHEFHGTHGPQFALATQHLDILRGRSSRSKSKSKSKSKGPLTEQQMADSLHRLQLEIRLIPGNAFQPTINSIPAAKFIESEKIELIGVVLA